MDIPNSPTGAGLTFTGMTDLAINNGFDLQFHLVDKLAQIYLCVGREDNRVPITGTTPASRQASVLAAIDNLGKWGEAIQLWMVSEKKGSVAARTERVNYKTYVKPFYGSLTITSFSSVAKAQPPLTYPGNGHGRLLSRQINGRYYFIYGGKLVTENPMRGFDCTSFPQTLLNLGKLPGQGYGKDVCEKAGAVKCDLEQLKGADFEKRFKEDSIPYGIYVLFSEGHVLLYNSDINWLYEFAEGGFKSTPGAQKDLQVKKGRPDLWWMRKLPDNYRSRFQ